MPITIKGTIESDTLSGTAGSDMIYGLDGRDVLIGLAGDDWLDGGAGIDRMEGGEGDDTYVVDSLLDKAVELADEGTDLVLAATLQYKLPDAVENLTFTSRGAHLGLGNALGNVITGNADADRLFGKAGDDTLIGGAGKDYLSGDNGNDQLQGGSGKDILRGGAGSDVLDGGLGADVMYGGRGNDVFIFDNLRDLAYDVASGGIDEVRSAVDATLSTFIENLTLVGPYSANGTGNALNNTIIGNDQRNALSGGDGTDVLDGGKGNDVLSGGAGADRFVFSAAPNRLTNVDQITDFARGEGDKFQLSNAVFTDFDGLGRISRDAFVASPTATRAVEDGQFLIYNTKTGALYYDAEGPGGRGPIQIAQLGHGDHPEVVWSDFLIIA